MMGMTEETLVQEVTSDYLLNDLHWNESVYGMNEVLGK
jgi:type I restriction enzyme R subunit